jgi:putative oxidoreductase
LTRFQRNYLLLSAAALAVGGVLHIAAIFGGPGWYAYLGAPAGLVALAGTDSLRPAISCVVIAMGLFACAAYGFSGAGVVRRLPALRTVLALVGLGRVARGLLFVPVAAWRPHLLSGLCGKCAEPGLFLVATSLLCLLVGGGYALGTLRVRS